MHRGKSDITPAKQSTHLISKRDEFNYEFPPNVEGYILLDVNISEDMVASLSCSRIF